MNKYINADILIRDIERSRTNNNHNNPIASQTHNGEHRHFIKMVLDQPTADVAEVKHGHWIHSAKEIGVELYYRWQCSICGRTIARRHKEDIEDLPYCHCGAKMDEPIVSEAVY